jgi:LPXTG-motif cell wall-anchored protein
MGEGVPAQVEDESVETKVFDYRIPMTVDGAPVAAVGTLTWVGRDEGFPVMPFIGLALIAASGTAFIFLRRRRREGRDADAGGSAGTPPPA